MPLPAPQRWNLTVEEAKALQAELRSRLDLESSNPLRGLHRVGGADVAYAADGKTLFGGVVVVTFPGLCLVEERWAVGKVTFPYIPGLLSFREAPIVLEAFSHLRQRPDVMLLDGQGVAHPRGLGLASHMALLLGLPTVGCAKSRLVGDHGPLGQARGSTAWLDYEGRRVGNVVRTRSGVRPLYVSPGNGMSLTEAATLALETSRGTRLPEPIRLAHRLVNRVRKEWVT